MKAELEQRLAEEFPFMRRGKTAKEQEAESGMVRDLYSAFGCDCGNGWYEVLRGLCAELTAVYAAAGETQDIIVDQVKEKFGTLRFYYHRAGQNVTIHAIDCLGGPSFRARQGASELDRALSDAVHKWEEKSATVCEICGKPGKLRKDLPWVRTLCDACYDEVRQHYADRRAKAVDLAERLKQKEEFLKED